jgi:hypothetical protein
MQRPHEADEINKRADDMARATGTGWFEEAGRSDEGARGALLKPIESADLMLATLRRAPFSLEGCIFEWKYDGFGCRFCRGKAVESYKGDMMRITYITNE